MSTFLKIPRELREEIFRHTSLPPTVFTSNAGKPDTNYVDTRIYLPSSPPRNLLYACRQLRQECLEHHAHILNSAATLAVAKPAQGTADGTDINNISDDDLDNMAERAVDDGKTLHLTLEVQRGKVGTFGYYVPDRKELSPQFLKLVPLMKDARILQLIIWPGFDWWNGPAQESSLEQWRQRKALLKRINAYQVGHTGPPGDATSSNSTTPRPDAVSAAIAKILDKLPAVEELDLSILVATGDLFRWDLPDVKWERIQPWLDSPVTKNERPQLLKVSRKLISVWQRADLEFASHQAFYVQKETRDDVSSNAWRVERQGGLRAVSIARSNLGHSTDTDCSPCSSISRSWLLLNCPRLALMNGLSVLIHNDTPHWVQYDLVKLLSMRLLATGSVPTAKCMTVMLRNMKNSRQFHRTCCRS
jgi:hypothetical protein